MDLNRKMTIIHPPMSYDLHEMMRLVSGEGNKRPARKNVLFCAFTSPMFVKKCIYSQNFVYLSFF